MRRRHDVLQQTYQRKHRKYSKVVLRTDVLVGLVIDFPRHRKMIEALRRWTDDDTSPLLFVEVILRLL